LDLHYKFAEIRHQQTGFCEQTGGRSRGAIFRSWSRPVQFHRCGIRPISSCTPIHRWRC